MVASAAMANDIEDKSQAVLSKVPDSGKTLFYLICYYKIKKLTSRFFAISLF